MNIIWASLPFLPPWIFIRVRPSATVLPRETTHWAYPHPLIPLFSLSSLLSSVTIVALISSLWQGSVPYFAQVLFYLLILLTLELFYCFMSPELRLFTHKKITSSTGNKNFTSQADLLCRDGGKINLLIQIFFYSALSWKIQYVWMTARNCDCRLLPSVLSLLLIDGQVGSLIMKFESPFRSECGFEGCVCCVILCNGRQ